MPAAFCRGKVYDDFGSYKKAFTHFTQANKLKQRGLDTEKWWDLIERSIAVFDTAFLSGFTSKERAGQQIVFIVGMPRSGTTLVEHILSSLSQVFGAGELSDINMISRELAKRSKQ